MFTLSLSLSAQFKAKDYKQIPSEYEVVIETRENESGCYLSYKNFKKGNIELANRRELATLMTTMMLGSGTYLYTKFQSEFSDNFHYKILKSNSFSSTKFKLLFQSPNLDVIIFRKLIYASPLLAGNAEIPNNYGMIIAFHQKDGNEDTSIIDEYLSFLKSKDVSYKIIRN
jgi:hypothetical protein